VALPESDRTKEIKLVASKVAGLTHNTGALLRLSNFYRQPTEGGRYVS
jgi:hypothetical protein